QPSHRAGQRMRIRGPRALRHIRRGPLGGKGPPERCDPLGLLLAAQNDLCGVKRRQTSVRFGSLADIAEPQRKYRQWFSRSVSDAVCIRITAQTELVKGVLATAVAALAYISPMILA